MPVRNNQHILGDIGELSSILMLNKFGWTANKIESDYGEDLLCNIFIDKQRTKFHFRGQVKSTALGSSYVTILKNGDYSATVSSSNVKMWISCLFPVFLFIYDESKDKIFYGLPVNQIIDDTKKLNSKEVKIRVKKDNELNILAKDDISKLVEIFYSNLYRLDSAKIYCDFYTVIMPEYRLLPRMDNYRLITDNDDVSSTNSFVDLLPSWMIELESIDPDPVIIGHKFSQSYSSIEDFIHKFFDILLSVDYKLNHHQWLAFSVSPIQVLNDQLEVSDWKKEITFWETYTILDGKVISDYDRSFKLSENFKRQIQRRAQSWEFFHHVDSVNNLGVQLFAEHRMSVGSRRVYDSHLKNTENQFVLWHIHQSDIEELAKMLGENRITVFSYEEYIDESEIVLLGSWMFNPEIGLYKMASSWEEYSDGVITYDILNKLYGENLPGKPYSGPIPEVFSRFTDKYKVSQNRSLKITEKDYFIKIPINHSKNEFWISKFYRTHLELSDREIDDLNLTFEPKNKQLKEREFGLIQSWTHEKIYELRLIVDVPVSYTSDDYYQEIISTLTKEITEFERVNSITFESDSREILHTNGMITFEK
jgi:hypothetical protein